MTKREIARKIPDSKMASWFDSLESPDPVFITENIASPDGIRRIIEKLEGEIFKSAVESIIVTPDFLEHQDEKLGVAKGKLRPVNRVKPTVSSGVDRFVRHYGRRKRGTKRQENYYGLDRRPINNITNGIAPITRGESGHKSPTLDETCRIEEVNELSAVMGVLHAEMKKIIHGHRFDNPMVAAIIALTENISREHGGIIAIVVDFINRNYGNADKVVRLRRTSDPKVRFDLATQIFTHILEDDARRIPSWREISPPVAHFCNYQRAPVLAEEWARAGMPALGVDHDWARDNLAENLSKWMSMVDRANPKFLELESYARALSHEEKKISEDVLRKPSAALRILLETGYREICELAENDDLTIVQALELECAAQRIANAPRKYELEHRCRRILHLSNSH